MGAADKVHVVFLQEARYYIWAECERNTTVILTPSSDILIGVGPQKIAEQSAIGDLVALCVNVWVQAERPALLTWEARETTGRNIHQ